MAHSLRGVCSEKQSWCLVNVQHERPTPAAENLAAWCRLNSFLESTDSTEELLEFERRKC